VEVSNPFYRAFRSRHGLFDERNARQSPAEPITAIRSSEKQSQVRPFGNYRLLRAEVKTNRIGDGEHGAIQLFSLTYVMLAFTIATLALQSPGGTTVSSLVGAIPFVTSVGLLFSGHRASVRAYVASHAGTDGVSLPGSASQRMIGDFASLIALIRDSVPG
jgi:hypothetical protein